MRTTLLLLAIVGMLTASALAQTTNVTVLWDPSPDAAVVPITYRLHWGGQTKNYTNSITSPTNGAVLQNIQFGVVYFIAVKASDTNGLTSDYSEELAFVYPRPGKRIRVAVHVQQSEDLLNWVDGPAFAVLDVSDRYRFFRSTLSVE